MRYLISFALLLPMVVFAKDPPLPEALLNAKTAYVEKAGNADELFDKYCKAPKANASPIDKKLDKYCKSLKESAKADKQFFDEFCKELEKWGRFTLVQDRNSADVRILLARTMRKSVARSIGPPFVPPGNSTYGGTVTVPGPGGTGNVNIVTDGGGSYATFGGATIATEPVSRVPIQGVQREGISESSSLLEEVILNIRDRRNDALLYLDQTERPGMLVSNLKHKMKRK
jgi:hypothetical protein